MFCQKYMLFWMLLGLSVFRLGAQNDTSQLAIGQWRSYLPLNTGRYVTQSPDRLFYAAEQSVLVIDKSEFSTDEISRIDGLSNSGIRLLRYHPGSKTLLVVYNNSVIDLIPDEGPVRTLNQIANFSNFVGEKMVFDLVVAILAYHGSTSNDGSFPSRPLPAWMFFRRSCFKTSFTSLPKVGFFGYPQANRTRKTSAIGNSWGLRKVFLPLMSRVAFVCSINNCTLTSITKFFASTATNSYP
jgi:hypothetical protein